MTIPDTLLTFVGAPAAIIAVITLAALGPSAMRTQSRYRPGRPWPHQPAWYIPHPAAASPPPAHGAGHQQLSAHDVPAIQAGDVAVRSQAAGGASGEW